MAELSTLILDRVRRVLTKDPTTLEPKIYLTNLSDVSLSATTESDEVVDAIGMRIAELDRVKNMELTGNTMFNTDLLAAQWGSEVQHASDENKIPMHFFDVFDVKDGMTEVKLTHLPSNDIKYISRVGKIGGVAKNYAVAAEATAEAFSVVKDTGVITLPTGVTGRFVVEYEFLATDGIAFESTATSFAENCIALMEVVYRDPCNQSLKYAGFVEMPNAKLVGDVDVSFSSDMQHPFTLHPNVDYCSEDQMLVRFSVPDVN